MTSNPRSVVLVSVLFSVRPAGAQMPPETMPIRFTSGRIVVPVDARPRNPARGACGLSPNPGPVTARLVVVNHYYRPMDALRLRLSGEDEPTSRGATGHVLVVSTPRGRRIAARTTPAQVAGVTIPEPHDGTYRIWVIACGDEPHAAALEVSSLRAR